jgi:hypothetical protein
VPWPGALHSPNLGVSPEAVDYFHGANAQKRSWRAVKNLTLVAGGRCTVALGLGGISQSYVPGGLSDPHPPAPKPGERVTPLTHDEHPWLFWMGLAGAILGLVVHTYGVYRFHCDTKSFNRKRAHIVATAATVGAFMVAGGGAQAAFAQIQRNRNGLWEALPVRAVGNFFVYGAVPNSFAASELVWGLTPIKHRNVIRDLGFATGGAMLMTWAFLGSPDPPAPLYAREIAQCLGIVCLAIGGALPRSEAMRAASTARLQARQPSLLSTWRRRSSAT